MSGSVRFTLQQLEALRAVVSCGGFGAGAKSLHKSHPSVVTAIKNLEAQLCLALFDREGYRTILTSQGREIYESALRVLTEAERLQLHAQHMRSEEETSLDIVIGDITPMAGVLEVLQKFSGATSHTQINLHFDNLSVPAEKLFSGEANIIVHHIDKADTRLEYLDFCTVEMLPVAAPGFLDMRITDELRYEDMKRYTQCVIRDPGQGGAARSYYLLDGARRITVGDQLMKKEVIQRGLGWGHMPGFMVADQLESGALVLLTGKHIRKRTMEIAVARLGASARRPVTERLWNLFRQHASALASEAGIERSGFTPRTIIGMGGPGAA